MLPLKKADALSMKSPAEAGIQFLAEDVVVLKINADGTIWLNPDIPQDDMVKAFVEALRPHFLALR